MPKPPPDLGRAGWGCELGIQSLFRGPRAPSQDSLGREIGAQLLGDPTLQRITLLDDFENLGLAWFWATDATGQLIYVSKKAADQLGKPPEELLGHPLASLFVADEDESGEKPERPLPFLFGARSSFSDMTVRVETGKSAIWWQITGRPQFDDAGAFVGFRGNAKDVTTSYVRQKEATRLSQYDSLTGLSNRHRMTKRLNAILTALGSSSRSCALMMLDLDRFKHVNDTIGHPAGDELLRQVAERLKRVVGHKGEVGRLGGDEFQIILPNVEDHDELDNLAVRIIQIVSQAYTISGHRALIGTSVGIAVAPYDGSDVEEITQGADLALYAAKASGRGQHMFYSSELKDHATERREIEQDLQEALSNGQLKLHYQPIVRACDHMLTGFEALLRWDHPERGTVSPDVFIAVAEETKLILQLGEWALRKACQDAASWPGELSVAVNISAEHFFSEDLPDIVAAALDSSGLAAERLELEITETVFLGDAEAADYMFGVLRGLGVRLALDDFGTGYSSLGYLRTAPFDRLKVDQSFVRGCTEPTAASTAIIEATISLATALSMESTAEGVETADELAIVRQRGITHVQGFVYSEAMANETVLKRLTDGSLCFDPVGPARQRPERQTVFRRVVVIHEGNRYQAVMRNISKSGAKIEGLLDVPVGTELLLDLGGGHVTMATVRRSDDSKQGVEFESPLVGDGRGGFTTASKVMAFEGGKRARKRPAKPAEKKSSDAEGSAEPRRFVEVEVSKASDTAG